MCGVAYRGELPSDLLDDLANESGALGKVSLATGDLGLGITGGELVVALVEPVGNAYCAQKDPISLLSVVF